MNLFQRIRGQKAERRVPQSHSNFGMVQIAEMASLSLYCRRQEAGEKDVGVNRDIPRKYNTCSGHPMQRHSLMPSRSLMPLGLRMPGIEHFKVISFIKNILTCF